MEIFKVVPKLEVLARDRAYKAILTDLSLCYGQDPTGNRFYRRSPECEEIRHRVRSQLDQTLVGIVSEQVRLEFLKIYYQSLKNPGVEPIVVDTWLFLDSVLDESCKELKIHIALPGKEASYQPIPTIIANRSPLLTKLTINFSCMKRDDVNKGRRECERKFETAIRSLASLPYLTDLGLIGMNETETLLMYILIGEACPSLSSLVILNCRIHNMDELIVALIMGKFATMFYSEDRPSWCEIDALERIDVPEEFRTPICSSLRQLQMNDWEWDGLSSSAAAFTLRNIPLLQKFTQVRNLGGGIEMLHHLQQENNSFQGKLSLKAVEGVNIKLRKKMLRAVGELCPLLEEVLFYGYFDDDEVDSEDFVSSEEIPTILSKWPKLSTLELYEVNNVDIQPILEVFGPELKSLIFTNCYMMDDGIKLTSLAPCSQLESLSLSFSLLDHGEDVSALDVGTFLPRLQSFYSAFCLGTRSRFFEEKSSLVSLDVVCSHVGMKLNDKRPLAHVFKSLVKGSPEFSMICHTWSQLETLIIRQFSSVSMDKMKDLLPYLLKLQTVVFPHRISSADVLLYQTIKSELINRKPPVQICFQDFDDDLEQMCYCYNDIQRNYMDSK